MGELRPDLAEGLVRESALRHVLHGADVLQLTIPVPRRVGDDMQVLDRAVGHLQPVLVLKVAAGASRPVDHVMHHREVFRMDASTDQVERHGHTVVKCE